MKLKPSDLIIRFESEENVVRLLIPHSGAGHDAMKRFFEIQVGEEVTVSDFAEEIGIAVASFLHARHGDRFKVVESEEEDEGDLGGQSAFEDARLLIDRINDDSTLEDLECIDVLLKRASLGGDVAASEYLRTMWPKLRSVFVRRVTRNA